MAGKKAVGVGYSSLPETDPKRNNILVLQHTIDFGHG
jgi:hypothetical protein